MKLPYLLCLLLAAALTQWGCREEESNDTQLIRVRVENRLDRPLVHPQLGFYSVDDLVDLPDLPSGELSEYAEFEEGGACDVILRVNCLLTETECREWRRYCRCLCPLTPGESYTLLVDTFPGVTDLSQTFLSFRLDE